MKSKMRSLALETLCGKNLKRKLSVWSVHFNTFNTGLYILILLIQNNISRIIGQRLNFVTYEQNLSAFYIRTKIFLSSSNSLFVRNLEVKLQMYKATCQFFSLVISPHICPLWTPLEHSHQSQCVDRALGGKASKVMQSSNCFVFQYQYQRLARNWK